MYLSRIALDINRRSVMKAMASPQLFHGVIESSFEGERKRRLWRLDEIGGQLYMLLLSEDKLSPDTFSEQFGTEKCNIEIKDYAPYLQSISKEKSYRFRLTANPVIALKKKGEKRGKICAHITPEWQKNWLVKKADSNGFSLPTDEFEVVSCDKEKFRKRGERVVTVMTVTFEGILTVTNEELFKKALTNGIGRAKAYGCGLLTVIPI